MKLPRERPGCAWLFASSGSRTMMVYYCTGGVLQYASGHLTPIELLHVHRVREGERVAKASPSPASHHTHGQGRDATSLTYCSCLCVYDRWSQQVVGAPIMQLKEGAVKAPELSPFYTIYKLEPQGLFARVCTLHTLAAVHIYIHTLEAQRSFARVCYIHSLSTSLHQI